ncbi:Non-specific serine/threonine protein kinase [Bertholletia excelsa]
MEPNKMPCSFILFIFLFQVVTLISGRPDSEILLEFKGSLITNNDVLSSWNTATSPCSGDKGNWLGVLCEKGKIWGLQLENMGLSGIIDIESLRELPDLRTISFMNNNFGGSLPRLNQLGALKSIYLSNNKFYGDIDGNAFNKMLSLKKLYLGNNQLTGHIPLSLTQLPKLIELGLEENQFEGEIPDFKLGTLRSFNASNNDLGGQIPTSLSKMDASSFSGNPRLCGSPLQACASHSNIPMVTIIIVVIAVVVALAATALVFFILRRRRQTTPRRQNPTLPTHERAGSADLDKIEQGSQHSTTSTKRGENSAKLSFLRDDVEKFDLADLLKASAEILGSGCFGSSYRAALTSGKTMVVKRFKHMNNVHKEEFREHMRRLGRLRHPNLLPIVAFYYRKEEKLLVSDYVNNANLAVYLHGNNSRVYPSLDWPTRLKIIKGVAKGLLYLQNELPSLMIPHGHLKSSNVLLNESFEPLLTDYSLVPIVNPEHAQEIMVAYKSPEYKHNERITKKTDVWSLGVIILEILTGKFPSNFLEQGKESDIDLVTWVQSVVHEERTGEVFDKEIGVTKNCICEMTKLLKIGLACIEIDVEKRSDMKDVVDKIEELKEKDIDEEYYSSHTSEGDLKSSRGLSDDFSFSING